MSFKEVVVANPSRNVVVLNKATGTVIAANTVLAYSSGLAIPATSATLRNEVAGIANQSISVADALIQVEALEIAENDTFIVDSTNNSNALHDGQRMVLTNAGEVNNTGTDNANGIVVQVGVHGVAADKKLIVKFV